jgi:hypothetical protein
MPAYKFEDIEVRSSLDVIRRHPSMYAGDPPRGPRLVEALVRDLVLLDALPVRIERFGSWWKVDSDKDWLKVDGTVSLEPFHKIITLPPPQHLGVRTEVLIAVLADAAVTCGTDGLTWIVGDQHRWPLPEAMKLAVPIRDGRTVAFTIDSEVKT